MTDDDTIRDTLEDSINDLATESWPDRPSGIRHRIYLDPETGRVYPSSHVGAGVPEPVWHGRHVTVCHVPGDAIPQSVVNVLGDRLGLLERVCAEHGEDLSDPDAYHDSAHFQLSQIEPEIACYRDPGDWYGESTGEITELVASGHSADQIVDILGTGDDYNGMVDDDAAVEWMTARCDEIRVESIDAIAEAEDAADLWEAAYNACALHQVWLVGSQPYTDAAITARDCGHTELADALDEAEAAQTRFERNALAELGEPLLPGPVARRCYGCGRPLDPHAPARVVYCGQCGDAQ